RRWGTRVEVFSARGAASALPLHPCLGANTRHRCRRILQGGFQGGERRRGLEEAWVRRRWGTFYSAVRPLRPGERNLALRGFEVPALHFGQPLARLFCNPFGLRGH
ncbi:hypothetical protein TraAM80_10474, partial [Trypanosoma rangeli]